MTKRKLRVCYRQTMRAICRTEFSIDSCVDIHSERIQFHSVMSSNVKLAEGCMNLACLQRKQGVIQSR